MKIAAAPCTVLDFRIERRPAYAIREPHAHNDVEMMLVTEGWLQHSMAGRDVRLSAGTCVYFWAGIPHRCKQASANSRIFLVHLPLAWFLGWNLPADLIRRLLGGEILQPAPRGRDSIEDSFARWALDQEQLGSAWKPVVLLELQAFFLRASLLFGAGAESSTVELDAAFSVVRPGVDPRNIDPGVTKDQRRSPVDHSALGAQILRYLVEHSHEKLTSADIGRAAGVHPNHAMRVFKGTFGLSIWTLLIQMRLMHAERLLLLTPMKVVDIAYEAGFGSVGHFYSAFLDRYGCSPKNYRLQASQKLSSQR